MIKEKILENEISLPMCIVNGEGKVVSATTKIKDVFLYDGIEGSDIFAITGIKYENFISAAKNEEPLLIERNEKTFKMEISISEIDQEQLMSIYFIDITELNAIAKKYEEEKICIAAIDVDNYDELLSSTDEAEQAKLASDISGEIRRWGSTINASVTRYSEHTFVLVFEKKYLKDQEEKKFPILDDIREIETEADFPVTLSIGVGIEGETPDITDKLSLEALDISKGRGGDQATVKEGDNLRYYGGKTQTVEKGNKGKSRIIGHALCRLIESASRVFVMGHKDPDMDSFGAALGIHCLSKPLNKETYIVLDKFGEAIDSIYYEAKETGDYDFIKGNKAMKMLGDRDLIIVVDTHRPSMTECPELLDMAARSVVIDHHRKAEEFIVNPTLAYTEPYASSTAELVTEILQYTVDRKSIEKIEADALLSGITVDTNKFSVKTGVRTFEAAAWLRRCGADTANVKRFFQTNYDTFRMRANCIAAATVDENGMAYSICEAEKDNSQVIKAQAADELLSIRGVKASFVAGRDVEGKTRISARSIGNVNVHLVMEKFGGGGHLNTAGAQVDISPEEAIEEIKKMMESEE